MLALIEALEEKEMTLDLDFLFHMSPEKTTKTHMLRFCCCLVYLGIESFISMHTKISKTYTHTIQNICLFLNMYIL